MLSPFNVTCMYNQPWDHIHAGNILKWFYSQKENSGVKLHHLTRLLLSFPVISCFHLVVKSCKSKHTKKKKIKKTKHNRVWARAQMDSGACASGLFLRAAFFFFFAFLTSTKFPQWKNSPDEVLFPGTENQPNPGCFPVAELMRKSGVLFSRYFFKSPNSLSGCCSLLYGNRHQRDRSKVLCTHIRN